jgi:two-component system, LuxR family, response regulator FixJ
MSAPVVHVVDDDESFLRSVTRLLRASGYEAAPFSSVEDFFERRDPAACGCVLTDLQMPRRSGLDLQEALARTRNPLPVVFLTAKGDIPTTVRAMRGGAEDFLTKRTPKARLLEAIDRALERDRRERAQREGRRRAREKLALLTDRERQVLEGVLRGLLNKQIADALGIAERTVKHHRTMLTQKLGVHSPAELAVLAAEAKGDGAGATR